MYESIQEQFPISLKAPLFVVRKRFYKTYSTILFLGFKFRIRFKKTLTPRALVQATLIMLYYVI